MKMWKKKKKKKKGKERKGKRKERKEKGKGMERESNVCCVPHGGTYVSGAKREGQD